MCTLPNMFLAILYTPELYHILLTQIHCCRTALQVNTAVKFFLAFCYYTPPPQKKIQLKLQTLMRSVLYDGYESMYNELFFKVLLTSYLSIMQSVLHWYEWKLNFTKRCSMQTHNTKFNWNPSISFTVKYSDGGADTLSAFIICKECIKQWTLH
jgi:hypothetical protein